MASSNEISASAAGTRNGVRLLPTLQGAPVVTSELVRQLVIGLDEAEVFVAGRIAVYEITPPTQAPARR